MIELKTITGTPFIAHMATATENCKKNSPKVITKRLIQKVSDTKL